MQAEELLRRRRDRLLATVLGIKERELDPYLPPEASAKFRKVVLDSINDFADLCLDTLRSMDDGSVVINELYLERINQIYDRVVANGTG